jgi:plasmid stabilization system protein ParE
MRYHLIIRPEAELDIQDGFEWYEAQLSGLGSEFIRAVDNCLSGIGRNPQSHPIVYKKARRALVRRFPYGVLYVFEQEFVAVVACFHSKRDPKYW